MKPPLMKLSDAVTADRHKALNAYTDACRQIELAQVCIDVLERMRGAIATHCIHRLQAEQQRALKLLDANAAKLGAPYPFRGGGVAPRRTGGLVAPRQT